MDRIIRVTGTGKISVKPDTIRLNISLEDTKETYEDTLQQSSVQTELLKDCFEKLGFERNNLKTLHFNVDTEYERYQDKKKEWKHKFVGYKFTHRLKIDFPTDNERLGKVLYALAHCPIHPKFTISYTVKDMEACKNQLLGKAVADSKQKAEILTQAAGTKLGEVISIDYSWGEMEIVSRPVNQMRVPDFLMESGCKNRYDMGIEPDDIDVTDTVTVVWSLGQAGEECENIFSLTPIEVDKAEPKKVEVDKMNSDLKSTEEGYVNKNNQKNVGRSEQAGTDNMQWFYNMECLECGHKYFANGTDIWQRKCPKCQGGRE